MRMVIALSVMCVSSGIAFYINGFINEIYKFI